MHMQAAGGAKPLLRIALHVLPFLRAGLGDFGKGRAFIHVGSLRLFSTPDVKKA
jgi:hypothetical protein